MFLWCSSYSGFSQAYIPMPADSGATWRYRIYDIDFITQVFDNILFLNGEDTFANGHTYHKIITRSCRQVGSAGFNPPIVSIAANLADQYYGAIRESGKQEFWLTVTGEDMMFDFNAVVNDSIPAYSGKIKVTAIDSVLLSGAYHKRYLTTDTGYYVVEGVGSSRGLIPALNDGSGQVQFYCFTFDSLTYSPDPALPCTYIYTEGYGLSVTKVNNQSPEITIYPNPVTSVLTIQSNGAILSGAEGQITITNLVGQTIFAHDYNNKQAQIDVADLPVGVYFLKVNGSEVRKFVKE